MIDVLLGATSVLVVIISVAIVFSLIEFRREVRILNQSLQRLENTLFPTIEKVSGAIEGAKEIVEKINSIAGDVKQVSGAGRDLAREIDKVTHAISSTTLRVRASAEGFKAGIWAALKFIKSEFSRKGGSDNG
ncbi:MAG: hypothetical protein M0Z75_06300 [Nitrospiraceae bacterium]|nr:hypothetical protein [Nitrospiraceae bacterium]MDA8090338.1 hypothetical protein [Nitrospiraceae bacterium]